MNINWNILATIASPIIALFIGAYLDHLIQHKPKVIAYLAHASSFLVNLPDKRTINIFTHSVVLRNAGRKTAKNVKLGHTYLPDFKVYPDIKYEVVDLPSGGKELIFPTLIPKKQVTVSYIYFPPITWDKINTHIESDEGAAKYINVLPTQQLSKWIICVVWFLIIYGIIGLIYSTIYILVLLIK